MSKSRKISLVGIAIFAVAFAIAGVYVAANASNAAHTVSDPPTISEAPEIVPVQTTDVQPPESVPVEPEAVQTYQPPIVTPNAEQKQQEASQLERIQFTNNPVTAGDPESYIGTYGQCPFYENAGEKGCNPPADIQCNADWSICEYIGGKNDQ